MSDYWPRHPPYSYNLRHAPKITTINNRQTNIILLLWKDKRILYLPETCALYIYSNFKIFSIFLFRKGRNCFLFINKDNFVHKKRSDNKYWLCTVKNHKLEKATELYCNFDYFVNFFPSYQWRYNHFLTSLNRYDMVL